MNDNKLMYVNNPKETIVKPVVVYGSETWAMTEMDMKRMGTWERKILRRTYGRARNMEKKN
jgi:predicted phosphohydrolase